MHELYIITDEIVNYETRAAGNGAGSRAALGKKRKSRGPKSDTALEWAQRNRWMVRISYSSGIARLKSARFSARVNRSAAAKRAKNCTETRTALPLSNDAYQSVDTPASSATSSRRNPATRRRPVCGRPTSPGFNRDRH